MSQNNFDIDPLPGQVAAPFIILFQGRCGSTHLVSLLNSHPLIQCQNEILTFDWRGKFAEKEAVRKVGRDLIVRELHIGGDKSISDPSHDQIIETLNDIFRKHEIQAAGFKVKFPRQLFEYPEAEAYFNNLGHQLRVIVLDRKNVLKRAISKHVLEIMRERGVQFQWQNLKTAVEFEPVEIEIDLVIRLASVTSQVRSQMLEHSTNFSNVLNLEYEDLRIDEGGTINRVLAFLNVAKDSDLTSEFVKVAPDQLSLAVKNYEDLCKAVRGSELENFLD